jgi:hypothetical protein
VTVQRRRLLLAALTALLALTAASASTARAADPCWKRVLVDWSKDGVISHQYSPRCLRQAMKHTPEDLRDYSSIIDDINAALIDATGGGGRSNGPNIRGGGSGNGSMGPTGNPSAKGRTGAGKRVVAGAGTPASAPAHSRSVPLPLILLGAVLLASALAAGSPPLVKRFRGRFPRLRPSTGSVRPPS